MSPRSTDTNAAQSKQKKKNIDAAIDASPSQPPAPTPAQPPAPAPPAPVSVSAPAPAPTQPQPTHHQSPRVFVASTLKPVSAIDTVTSTISALSHHANRGISSLIAAHSTAPDPASPHLLASTANSTPLRTDGSVSPIYDAFHNAGATPVDPDRIHAALSGVHPHGQPPRKPSPLVLWSRWDRLPNPAHPHNSLPILISYFDDGCLQALVVQDRNISELLCLPHAAQALLEHDHLDAAPNAKLLTAFIRHPLADSAEPQLLMVLQEQQAPAQLIAYSLSTHRVHRSVELQHRPSTPSEQASPTHERSSALWQQVDVQSNQRFLVLSFASPPSIHVLSASTLQYLHPPLLDAASPSDARPPSISLSNRLLAYASTSTASLSPIRFDARTMPNTSFPDSSRPHAGPHPAASARVGEMRDNLFETSAQVGDAARRITGGVISGVRTLGEWGSSYWPNPGSPPTPAAFTPPNASLLSQSAPHSVHPSRPASSAFNSPSLLALDSGPTAKRLSSGTAISPLTKSDATSHASASQAHAACIRVVDLGSYARTVCAFAPSSSAIALIAFSPCGRMILAADVLGHAFHVFELPIAGAFGSSSQPSASTVLHRYKLIRGITVADAVHAEWSHDAQWIAIGTRSGSVHIYAVNPFGGLPSIANHVLGKVRNPQALQPFGISLHSSARSVRPAQPVHQDASAQSPTALRAEAGPATPLGPANSTKYSPPSFLLINGGSSSSDADPGAEASTPFELLTNDPRSASVTLHSVRCWSSQARSRVAAEDTETLHSASPEAKQRFASSTSPRSSGLTHMMRKAGEGLLSGQHIPRLQVECTRVALWDHLVPDTDTATKHSTSMIFELGDTSRLKDRSDDASPRRTSSIAKAEIETYSQAPAMLPSSIYLSRQTFFHARTPVSGKLALSAGATASSNESYLRCIQRRGSRPIQVRRTARLVSREPSSEGPSSFGDSLSGAFDQMSFHPDKLPPRSASAHIPSFPQGQRGRSSGWTSGSSIPIRIVAGGLGGIYRAGKELGRGVEMARRRTSGASRGIGPDLDTRYAAASGASVSFDGEDDVDLLGDDEGMRASAQRRYVACKSPDPHLDAASMPSQASLMSTLRNDGQLRGSQPSSAETPSTRFSETEDAGLDGGIGSADDCDWDAIEASRSPVPLQASVSSDGASGLPGMPGGVEIDSLDDDFTVGRLDEDSGQSTVTQSLSNIAVLSQPPTSKVTPPKELVYALPAGASTRSSLLSQSTGLAGPFEARSDVKDPRSTIRDASPSQSDGGGDSGSQDSAASGLLCEGSKETFVAEAQVVKVEDITPIPVAKISTSGGGGKKKKKKSGR